MRSCLLVMTTSRMSIAHMKSHTVSPKYDAEGHVEEILVDIIVLELQSQRKRDDVALPVT